MKIYRMSNRAEPRMPFAILTASATVEARNECEAAGVDAFLTKPIDAHTLLDTVALLTSSIDHSATGTQRADLISNDTGETPAADEQLINKKTLHHLRLLGAMSDNFLDSVIHGFFQEGEQLLDGMNKALKQHEYVQFKELAHALKGSSGNLGADSLFRICREISYASQADLQASADNLLKKARDSFNETRQAMIRYLDEHRQALGS